MKELRLVLSTQLNSAAALNNLAWLLLQEGSRLEEAEKAANDAIAVLGRLRDAGDATEPTLIGLAMGTSAVLVVNPAIMDKLPYDPMNDYTFIGPVFRNPLIIVANDKSPYRTLKDVVDAAKKDPGKLNDFAPPRLIAADQTCNLGPGSASPILRWNWGWSR